MVLSCRFIDNYLGRIEPILWECLKALTPEQVEQNMENKIPKAAIPRASLKK